MTEQQPPEQAEAPESALEPCPHLSCSFPGVHGHGTDRRFSARTR